MMKKTTKETIQYGCAIASFIAAIMFGLLGVMLTEQHDPAGGTLTLIAQLLLFTASVFGIDYKWNNFDRSIRTHEEDQEGKIEQNEVYQ